MLEVLPKDKKAKEEKTNVLGQTCVDLLPLLNGKLITACTAAYRCATCIVIISRDESINFPL